MAKLFVILATLCVFGAVAVKGFDKQAAVDTFMTQMEDCKKEVGAKDTDTEELLGKKPASSMEGKCLRACLMNKFKVLDGNGKFVKAVAVKHAETYTDGAEDKMKIAHEMINACGDIEVAADRCEAAEQYGKCLKEQAGAHGLKDNFDLI